MGYACPVCEVPQQDAEHLANHLAFTAMLHDDEHADWLDESVPDWRAGGPADLAPRVADLAEESDYDAVFEDTTGGHGHDHDHAHGHGHEQDAAPHGVDPAAAARRGGRSGGMDDETAAVLSEARELTREMLADDVDGDGDTDDADGDPAGAAEGDGSDAATSEGEDDGDEAGGSAGDDESGGSADGA
jgi:hypothetical protein